MNKLPAVLILLAIGVAAGGCASSCSATPDKLDALRRGMTYGEATAVIGCTGTLVTPNGPDSDQVSSVEWQGPRRDFVSRTQLDFRDGRLLYFTSGTQGAW